MSLDDSNNMAKLGEKYISAVEQAGGIPLAIPLLQDKNALKILAHRLDGIILSGGPDIDPSYFHEMPHPCLGSVCPQRDETEIFITAEIIKLSKPLLGICRGLQVMNVAMGGTLYQDISSNIKEPIKHIQDAPRWHKSHEIEIVDIDSLIYKIIGKRRIRVNSFHHQSVERPAPDFKITALAPDGVIEAMESNVGGFCLGVQWHPEELIDDAIHLRLFESMIDAAKDVKTRRK